jgi:DNA gyrase inhibitor GyrI
MKIETLPQQKIIFMRRTGEYGAKNHKLMETFKYWLKTNQLFNENTVILGIAQDDPTVTTPEHCRYDVGCVVTSFNTFSEADIHFGKVPSGKYAVFTLAHTAEAMNEAWQNIPEDIEKTDYQIDYCRPIIERYAIQMVDKHLCEICVPVE